MTFYEAAVEVLRRRQQPLHYKKIADLAIEENLLSHVGRMPHKTMFDRLKKSVHEKSDNYLEQAYPGVYRLQNDVIEKLNQEARKRHKKEEKRLKKRKKLRENRFESNGSTGSKNLQAPQRVEDYDSFVSASRIRPIEDKNEFGEGGDFKATDLVDGTIDLGEIPQAAYKVLREAGEPLNIDVLSDRIFNRKLANFHTTDEPATVQAALATDNQVRESKGQRALFSKYDESRWGLTDWGLRDEDRKREQTILSLAQKIQESTLDQLASELQQIPTEAFEQIAIFLLRQMGYEDINVAQRTDDNDVFFSAEYNRGVHESRVCIEITGQSNKRLQPSDIDELRKALKDYSASKGLLIHLGNISSDAVEKTKDGDAIDLLDRDALVQLLFRHEVGIRDYKAPIYFIDRSFLKGLER